MGSRVKRYMRLDAAFLSNHHTPNEPPTWRVNIKDAHISCNTKKNRITIDLYGNKLELYADTSHDCDLWYDALTASKAKANLSNPSSSHANGKENNQPSNQTHDPRLINMQSCDMPDPENNRSSKRASDLGKNFKVVKPQPSNNNVLAQSSAASDDPYDGQQPLAVNGQVYEETPASMIFKQFNFPAK